MYKLYFIKTKISWLNAIDCFVISSLPEKLAGLTLNGKTQSSNERNLKELTIEEYILGVKLIDGSRKLMDVPGICQHFFYPLRQL